MSLQTPITTLQSLPTEAQGKARESERLLELRRSTEGESAPSLRLTITLRDDTAGKLMFDALLQRPAAPGDKSLQLKAVDDRDLNKREQRCVAPMISWANQILNQRQDDAYLLTLQDAASAEHLRQALSDIKLTLRDADQ